MFNYASSFIFSGLYYFFPLYLLYDIVDESNGFILFLRGRVSGSGYEVAIRGIVAVQYIYPLFIFIWVELYLTLYTELPFI